MKRLLLLTFVLCNVYGFQAKLGFMNWASSIFKDKFTPTLEKKSKGFKDKIPVVSSSPPPQNATLIFGGTGKAGREIIQALLQQGMEVVLAVRNKTKAKETLEEFSKTSLFLSSTEVDLTNASTIDSTLFQGITSVISCVGPSFNDNSEVIDYKGNLEVISAISKYMNATNEITRKTLVDFSDSKSRNVSIFSRLDDVIMGGRSSSTWTQSNEDDYASWIGNLIVEGGGFCGTVIRNIPFDVEGFDGIYLSCKGDGSRYKFRLKPDDLAAKNEYQYQASFDSPTTFADVYLPFDSFNAVRRNDVIFSAPKVHKGESGTNMSSIGLVLSRFEYDELPNKKCSPGEFELCVRKIGLYKSPRPSFILVSSAGAERINILTPEERAKDVPIVQLNPQGILNWKYLAEESLRLSGIDYAIVRPTGLVNGVVENGQRKIDFAQGDDISGRISRSELAQVLVGVLKSPYSNGKTFEVRRDESSSGLLGDANWGISTSTGKEQDMNFALRRLVLDSDRVVQGMRPFPKGKLPDEALSEERVAQILNDPRVQAAQTSDRETR